MFPSHSKILDALKEKPMSQNELAKATGLSKDGIRGRISEMRSRYDIKIKNIKGKYHYKNPEKVIKDYLGKNYLYGSPLSIEKLKEGTGLSEEEILDVLTKLAIENKLVQKNTEVFYIKG